MRSIPAASVLISNHPPGSLVEQGTRCAVKYDATPVKSEISRQPPPRSATICVDSRIVRSLPSRVTSWRKRMRSSGSSPTVGSSTNQYFRFVHQRLRNAESANHAAGELLDLAVGDGLKPTDRQQPPPLGDAAPALRQARHPGEGVDDLLGSVQPPSAEFLRQVADERAHFQRFPRRVVTAHRHGAPGRLQQRRDNAQQGALARAVRPEQTEQARAQREIHIRERGVATLVGVADAAGSIAGASSL